MVRFLSPEKTRLANRRWFMRSALQPHLSRPATVARILCTRREIYSSSAVTCSEQRRRHAHTCQARHACHRPRRWHRLAAAPLTSGAESWPLINGLISILLCTVNNRSAFTAPPSPAVLVSSLLLFTSSTEHWPFLQNLPLKLAYSFLGIEFYLW